MSAASAMTRKARTRMIKMTLNFAESDAPELDGRSGAGVRWVYKIRSTYGTKS